jgi:hypothetical protein
VGPRGPLFLRVFELTASSSHELTRPKPLGHRPVAPCGAAGTARGALRAPRAAPYPPRAPTRRAFFLRVWRISHAVPCHDVPQPTPTSPIAALIAIRRACTSRVVRRRRAAAATTTRSIPPYATARLFGAGHRVGIQNAPAGGPVSGYKTRPRAAPFTDHRSQLEGVAASQNLRVSVGVARGCVSCRLRRFCA